MKTKAFIYVVIAGVMWGTSGLFVNYLAPYGITSAEMTHTRALVSFLCLLVYTLIGDRRLFRADWKGIILFALAGCSIFGTAFSYYTAMQMTSVSTAVVLMYTAPIYVMIYSVLFLGERLSPLKIISAVAMLIGCCLVSGIIGGFSVDPWGLLIGILSGVIYALYNIFTKLSARRGASNVTASVYGFGFMTLASFTTANPISLAGKAAVEPLITIPLLIGLGAVTCAIPYFLYSASMKHLSAGTASVLGIIEPMSATVFSVALLGEDLDAFAILGILLILVSVVLLGLAESNRGVRAQAVTDKGQSDGI